MPLLFFTTLGNATHFMRKFYIKQIVKFQRQTLKHTLVYLNKLFMRKENKRFKKKKNCKVYVMYEGVLACEHRIYEPIHELQNQYYTHLIL